MWSFQDVVIDELQSRDQNFDWAHKRFFGHKSMDSGPADTK